MHRRSLLAGLIGLPGGLAFGSQARAATGTTAGAPTTNTMAAAVKKKGVSAWNFTGVSQAMADSKARWFHTWASDKQQINPRPASSSSP
ncbi:hypothetical protein ACH4UM_34705 [Streptomyces sp. NPDC020801]|uniref:hypothetical protein n=1 Tax=Streptomyces sp. NPDC020801 TaxID=3365093 RepID=UPI0037BB6AAC